MNEVRDRGTSAARLAHASGWVALPLIALSYLWVPFQLAGSEPPWVLGVTRSGEILGALSALAAAVVGLIAWRRARPRPSGTARRAVLLGVVGLVLVVGGNILLIAVLPQGD